MHGIVSRTADGNVFEDLSGISNSSTGNPYEALIQACENDAVSFSPSAAYYLLIFCSFKSKHATKPTERQEIANKSPSFLPLISPVCFWTLFYRSVSAQKNSPIIRILEIVSSSGLVRLKIYASLWISSNGNLSILHPVCERYILR